MSRPEFERLESRIVYANRWMRVREDKFRRPDGSDGVYGIVEKGDYVLVIPYADGYVWLVEQYRYPVEGRYWEFPQGSWEHTPEARPEDVAYGELEEETGFRARQLERLGTLFQAYGYSNQAFHVYLAQDLVPGPRKLDVEESDLVSRRFSLVQLESMLRSGEIRDVSSVAAYGLAQLLGIFH